MGWRESKANGTGTEGTELQGMKRLDLERMRELRVATGTAHNPTR